MQNPSESVASFTGIGFPDGSPGTVRIRKILCGYSSGVKAETAVNRPCASTNMDSTAADMAAASARSARWTRRSFLGLASVATLVGLAGCSSQSSTSPSGDSDESQLEVDRDGYDGDAFAGTLTEGVESTESATVEPGIYEGEVVYDRSCESVVGLAAVLCNGRRGPIEITGDLVSAERRWFAGGSVDQVSPDCGRDVSVRCAE